jgi:hypothetical protein
LALIGSRHYRYRQRFSIQKTGGIPIDYRILHKFPSFFHLEIADDLTHIPILETMDRNAAWRLGSRSDFAGPIRLNRTTFAGPFAD